MKTYYIVKGVVTDTEAHENSRLGDTEWQFSDGPPGERGSSADFTSLENGLRYLSPAIFIWDKSNDVENRVRRMNAELPQATYDMLKLKGMI